MEVLLAVLSLLVGALGCHDMPRIVGTRYSDVENLCHSVGIFSGAFCMCLSITNIQYLKVQKNRSCFSTT